MLHHLTVLNNVNLLPAAENEIRALAGGDIIFPSDNPAEAELIARTGSAEAVLVGPGTRITSNYLQACPSVRYIGVCGTSMTNIDLNAVAQQGVAITNVADYGDEPTAEFIFMQLVALARGIGKYQWHKYPTELMDKAITIVGLGALGKTISHLALAYKMRVSYYSTHRKPDWEAKGLQFGTLNELLPTTDIIVTSVPTDTHVLGQHEFGRLPKGTVFVQASMGTTFDKPAFEHWMAQGGNFAIFDYAAGEENYRAYKDLPNVVFPKIVSAYTVETRERLGHRVLENLKQHLH